MAGKNTQKGSDLVYILIAISLLAALTATFMDNSSQQTTSQNTFNSVTDLNSQINFIRSSIQECVLTYPAGDETPAYQALPPTNIPYPLNPANANYTPGPCACTTGVTNEAIFFRCPGLQKRRIDFATQPDVKERFAR